MGRVVSPTPTPLSSGRVVPALVASYDMHGRAVGLFYTQPTGQYADSRIDITLFAADYRFSLLDKSITTNQRTEENKISHHLPVDSTGSESVDPRNCCCGQFEYQ